MKRPFLSSFPALLLSGFLLTGPEAGAVVVEHRPAPRAALPELCPVLFGLGEKKKPEDPTAAALAEATKQIAALDKDLAGYEKKLTAKPDNARAMRDAANCLRGLIGLRLFRREPGDVDAALANATRHVTLRESLRQPEPANVENTWDVAYSMELLGMALLGHGQPGDADQAVEHLVKGLKLREDLLKENLKAPWIALAADAVAVSVERLGQLLRERGRPGDAEKALGHMITTFKLREALLKREPESPDAKFRFAASHGEIGDLLGERGLKGDVEKAQAYQARQVDMLEAIRKELPESKPVQRSLAMASAGFGSLLSKRGKPEDMERAGTCLDRGLELTRSLLKEEPASLQAGNDVAYCLDRTGDYLRNRKKPGDEARGLASHKESLAISEDVLKRSRSPEDFARGVLVSMMNFASHLGNSGKPADVEQALNLYRKAEGLAEGPLAGHPGWREATLDLTGCLGGRALLLIRRGQPADLEKVQADLSRCLALHDGLLKVNPDLVLAARSQAITCLRMADLCAVTKKEDPGVWVTRAWEQLNAMKQRGQFLSVQDQALLEELRVKLGK